MSDNATTPGAVADAAIQQWLAQPALESALFGPWTRIGVAFDWGCPTERGVVLVMLLAGGSDSREG